MHERTAILITEVLLDGEFTEKQVRHRLTAVFQSGRKRLWAKQVFELARATATDGNGQLIAPKLVQTLINDSELSGVALRVLSRLDSIATELKPNERPTARMLPISEGAAQWTVPSITTTGQLAAQLSIPHRHLEWFADPAGREAWETTEQLRHYRYRWIHKQSGGQRLLETPKPKLKRIQRMILSKILNRIPVHPSAHGFVQRKSCITAAQRHARKQIVLRIDLRHFFPSIHSGKVIAIFRSAGYPQPIAQQLAGLCTNTTARSMLEQHVMPPTVTHRFHDPASRHFLLPHLPQGSPTSPALANLAASKLDARLSGLANAFNATYTRYADDLVFSGNEELSRGIARARLWICAICLNEGFQIQHRKTTIQRQHQQQRVHGIVVNSTTAVSRKQRDDLKAILHNCIRHGPAACNRNELPDFRAHLQGRIAMVASTCQRHGEKLKTLFKQVSWDA